MPAAASGRRPPPVTLRDFLELGCESSSDGFRSYPRYHHPRDDGGVVVFHAPPPARPHDVAEAAGGVLRRSPSWSPSAFLFFPKSPGALARISRSFSRRISFWRRRNEYDDDDLDDGRDSCDFPSPRVSSCSASSSEQGDDIVIEAATSSSSAAPLSEEASASSADRDCTDDVPGAAGDGHKQMQMQARVDDDGDPAAVAVGRGSKLETDPEEDKQHRSPVSVLDFPYDDDEEERSSDAGTCSSPASSSFPHRHCSLAAHHDLQKNKKAHKVRRRIDDGPTTTTADATLDLEARFTTASDSGVSVVTDDAHHLPSNICSSSSTDDGGGEAAKATTAKRHDDYEEHQTSFDDDERCEGQDAEEPDDDDDESYRLLARLLDDAAASGAAVDEVSEWLLLDFLAEGIAHLRSRTGPVLGTTANKNKPLDDGDGKVAAALVEPAMEWLRGAGPQWSVRDVMFSGESALKDMERSRRWMCVNEEEQDVGAEVEAFVMDTLLDELVTDLAR